MVSCFGGVSRSSTTVVSYLIKNRQMTAYDALTALRTHRNVNPSKQQLLYIAKLHNKIHGFKNINEDDYKEGISKGRQLILGDAKGAKELK